MKAGSALAWFVIQQQQQQQNPSLALSTFLRRTFATLSSTDRLTATVPRHSSYYYYNNYYLPYHCNYYSYHCRRRMSSSSTTTTAAAAADNESTPTTTTPDSSIHDINVAENLRLVRESIQNAAPNNAQQEQQSIRLVAVSKTKPLALLQKAYTEGNCRIFGENYVQELVEKVPQMPSDVTWHFIGALQSNKANMLVKAFDSNTNNNTNIDRLVVETVDKIKLANKLNHAVAATHPPGAKLKIFVQVNTSGEDSKSGCEPTQVVDLCRQIIAQCPHLQLVGLMTIGAPGDTSCFDTLVACREAVQTELHHHHDDDGMASLLSLELSMGMSGDYLDAIAKGATNVRVGSTIFGARKYDK